MHLPGVQTLDEVRASGRYRFLTPDQLIAEVRDLDDYGPIVLASAGRRHAGRRSVEVGRVAGRQGRARAHLTALPWAVEPRRLNGLLSRWPRHSVPSSSLKPHVICSPRSDTDARNVSTATHLGRAATCGPVISHTPHFPASCHGEVLVQVWLLIVDHGTGDVPSPPLPWPYGRQQPNPGGPGL